MTITPKNSTVFNDHSWSDDDAHYLSYEFASALGMTLPDPTELISDQIAMATMDYYGEKMGAVQEHGEKMGAVQEHGEKMGAVQEHAEKLFELGTPNMLDTTDSLETTGFSRYSAAVYIKMDYTLRHSARHYFILSYGAGTDLTTLLDKLGLAPWLGLVIPQVAFTIFARPLYSSVYRNTGPFCNTAATYQQVLAPGLQTWIDHAAQKLENWLEADRELTRVAKNSRLFRATRKNNHDAKDVITCRRYTLLDAMVPGRLHADRGYTLTKSIQYAISPSTQRCLIEMSDSSAIWQRLEYKEQDDVMIRVGDCKITRGQARETRRTA